MKESETDQKLTFKFNLRNIGKYADCLSGCIEPVRQSIIQTTDCYGCEKACGGIQFQFDSTQYAKCPWYAFKFHDLSEKAVENYISLIESEDYELRSNNR